jgi:hypothetical protein
MIDQKRRERINIWWVIGSGVMGAVLLAAALLAEHLRVLTTVSLEILVSTGAAVLLAGFLFFLQRHFVSEVEHVVTRAAESAAETLVDERMRQVGARIDELGKRLDEAVAARSERQDAAVEAMGTPTFVTVANALAEANNLAAVGNGVIRVQGSRQRGELALDFSWGVAMGDGRFGEPERTELSVSAHVYADDRTTGCRAAKVRPIGNRGRTRRLTGKLPDAKTAVPGSHLIVPVPARPGIAANHGARPRPAGGSPARELAAPGGRGHPRDLGGDRRRRCGSLLLLGVAPPVQTAAQEPAERKHRQVAFPR